MDDEAKRRQKEAANKQLLAGLKDLVWKTYELEETIKNFGPDSQPVLEDRLFRFIEGVRELVPAAKSVEEVQFPTSLLQYVDLGGNPHQYTAEVFRACTRDNQISKGKVDAVQALEQALTARMEQDYPVVAHEYKSLTKDAGH